MVESKIVVIASKGFHERRCFARRCAMIFLLLKFYNLFHEKVQDKQTSRPGCLIGGYGRVSR